MPQLAPVYETCQPRSELLQGTLPEDLFAAKIRPVVQGTAPEVYQNADRFFANTFPTDGISTLIREVFSRLAGQDSGSPVIRLETSFGGGKTHDEIALWHICKQGRNITGLDRFTDINLIPDRPINIAAIDGRDLDISAGNHYRETGITTYTIWGELAYQIGGIRGYELLNFQLTPGNVDDRQPIRDLLSSTFGKVFADIAVFSLVRYNGNRQKYCSAWLLLYLVDMKTAITGLELCHTVVHRL